MARSKHTAPRCILAAKRVRAPHESRGADDRRKWQCLTRILTESGLPVSPPTISTTKDAPLPKIRVLPPRPGWLHPAAQADIKRLLRFFGESCYYGLRAIELRQVSAKAAPGALLLGQLLVPGRIILYEQRPSPWLIRGALPARERAWLRQAGAEVTEIGEGVQTRVVWPEHTLSEFMLFDVLMHEVGHHLIQQYNGKRTVRTARTKDHEAFANRFAQRCRYLYHQPTQT